MRRYFRVVLKDSYGNQATFFPRVYTSVTMVALETDPHTVETRQETDSAGQLAMTWLCTLSSTKARAYTLRFAVNGVSPRYQVQVILFCLARRAHLRTTQ